MSEQPPMSLNDVNEMLDGEKNSRREFLGTIGAGTAGLAGCLGGGENTEENSGNSTNNGNQTEQPEEQGYTRDMNNTEFKRRTPIDPKVLFDTEAFRNVTQNDYPIFRATSHTFYDISSILDDINNEKEFFNEDNPKLIAVDAEPQDIDRFMKFQSNFYVTDYKKDEEELLNGIENNPDFSKTDRVQQQGWNVYEGSTPNAHTGNPEQTIISIKDNTAIYVSEWGSNTDTELDLEISMHEAINTYENERHSIYDRAKEADPGESVKAVEEMINRTHGQQKFQFHRFREGEKIDFQSKQENGEVKNIENAVGQLLTFNYNGTQVERITYALTEENSKYETEHLGTENKEIERKDFYHI